MESEPLYRVNLGEQVHDLSIKDLSMKLSFTHRHYAEICKKIISGLATNNTDSASSFFAMPTCQTCIKYFDHVQQTTSWITKNINYMSLHWNKLSRTRTQTSTTHNKHPKLPDAHNTHTLFTRSKMPLIIDDNKAIRHTMI